MEKGTAPRSNDDDDNDASTKRSPTSASSHAASRNVLRGANRSPLSANEKGDGIKGDSSDSGGGSPVAATKAGRWTVAEHQLFLRGLKTYGKEWKLIAEMIKTRTVVQIRTHAQKYYQKLAKMTGGPVKSTSKKEDIIRPSGSRSNSRSPPGKAREGKAKRKDGRSKSTSPAKKNKVKIPPQITTSVAFIPPEPPSKRPSSSRSSSFSSIAAATPRTVAAATILLKPRIQNRLEIGAETPRTIEAAKWLHSQVPNVSAALTFDESCERMATSSADGSKQDAEH